MNFLQISLTNRCNLACWHCPMGKWRNSEEPRWPLCNAELIPWMGANVPARDWIVELTGGEPSLYAELPELLDWLAAEGYRVVIKTNGTGNIPHMDNVVIASAFHRLDRPPVNYDRYLIVDKIDREEKEAYCRERGIPYTVIGYGKENPDGATHGFDLCAFINPAGHQVGCCARPPIERVRKGVDYNRISHRPLVAQPCCPQCKAAIDCWRFLKREWRP